MQNLSGPFTIALTAFTNGDNTLEWEVKQELGGSGFIVLMAQ
jgi:hypothetical protein